MNTQTKKDGGIIMHRIIGIVTLVIQGFCMLSADAQVSVVTQGKASAVVVIADEPTRTAMYAADELVGHVELATGVTLEIVPESKSNEEMPTRIYVGETETAFRQGIDVNRLPREASILRSVGNDLFILGKEDEGDPMDERNPNVGTLFGVYEFLEDFLGVRWLWPGDLGTHVPKANTVMISSINRIEAPSLLFRKMRWSIIGRVARGGTLAEEDARYGFSPEIARRYGQDLGVLFRRNRMGGMDAKPPSGHIAIGWWDKYSAEHPEWFAMCSDGTRGNPRPDREIQQVPLCVTNEELQDFIVDQWDGESTLVLGPIDHVGRCICDNCRAWDGPQPEDPPWFARLMYSNPPKEDVFYGQTSDRYARFWKIIQEKARKRNPNVLVSISFLYENEFTAPVTGITLNKNISGEFVQWRDPHLRYFPMPDEALEWIKEQWMGWKKTGIRMSYRPNYMHDGYVLPHFDTWQSGGFFKFAYENGMEGAEFDSYTGQWAVQGLRLYMHMRLMTDPGLTIREIRGEYFSAFGPAAKNIERYCNYWEEYAIKNVLNFVEKLSIRRYANYPVEAHRAFPDEVFKPAEAILDQALADAQTDPLPEYAERVEFLRVGLQHARLAVKVASIYDGTSTLPEERLEEARKALKELVQFRKEHMHLYFSDLLHVTSYWERPQWNLDKRSGL
jgi:hypothetical protein